MKYRNTILACLLASLTALAGLVSAVASAQTGDATNGKSPRFGGFVIYRNEDGQTVCRDADASELRQIIERGRNGDTQLIYSGAPQMRTSSGKVVNSPFAIETATGTTQLALLPSAGLHIFLHGTTQLNNNTEAKNAFIVAANRWESRISTPINVVIDVDYGTTVFNESFPSGVIGETGTSELVGKLSDVRQRLLDNSPTSGEQAIYNALPTASVPTTLGGSNFNSTSVRMTIPNARALGLAPDIASPDVLTVGEGDAAIGFNSAFPFDFNPNDGIDSTKIDFDAVVTHEIGHALGFSSDSGGPVYASVSMWDLFRFRPGAATAATFGSTARLMSAGGTQVYFNGQTNTFGTQELKLSTGGPDGKVGDGNQSSHWKDSGLNGGQYIGIMDPTIGDGVRQVITANDEQALDSFGYSLAGNNVGHPAAPPPPPTGPPSNDNFANAITLNGSSGTLTSDSTGATKQTGEPLNVSGSGGGRSVWFNWTAPASGTTTIDTEGSAFDTTLGVYTGSNFNSLTLVGANDDVQGGFTNSKVTFTATAGTTYRIMLDGYDNNAGAEFGYIQLNWLGATASPTPTPTPASYSVSGRVVDPDGSPLVNVQITLDGPNLTTGFPALPAFTDVNGNYSFTNLTGGGNYSVRGSDSRYTFGGGPYVFNQISFNQTGVNFTATAPASITGTATIAGSAAPLPGVLVGVFGGSPSHLLKQTTTDATGRWSFSGLTLGQSYNWVFVKSGYTFNPPSFIGVLSSTPYDIGNVIATPTNPIDASDFFVTQHYRDFLGREPDASGLAFWTNEIESCGFDMQCRQVKRINVSGAFFLSIEFQNTGYLVERMYKTAYGDTTEQSTGLVVPIIRRSDFLTDSAIIRNGVIVGVGDWQAQLEANKASFAQVFVQRQRFTDAYPSTMTPAQFVAKLNQNTGGVLTQAQVDSIALEMSANMANGGVDSARAVALRRVAESSELDRVEKSRAFVLMQYYGYLRRNPNDAPEVSLNFAGWNFWLTKLIQANGDFVRAEMVKAFLDSTEYRQRFGN